MDTTRSNEINLNFFFVLLWTIRARKWQSWREEKEPVEMQKLRSRTVTLVTKKHQQQAIEPGYGLDHLNKLLVSHAAGIFKFCSITAVPVHSSVLSTSISSTLAVELSQRKKIVSVPVTFMRPSQLPSHAYTDTQYLSPAKRSRIAVFRRAKN